MSARTNYDFYDIMTEAEMSYVSIASEKSGRSLAGAMHGRSLASPRSVWDDPVASRVAVYSCMCALVTLPMKREPHTGMMAHITRHPEMAMRCFVSVIRWVHSGWDSGIWSALSQPTNFGRPKQVAVLAIALPLRQAPHLVVDTRLNRHYHPPISCHRSGLFLPICHVLAKCNCQSQDELTDLSFRGTLNTNWSCLSYLV